MTKQSDGALDDRLRQLNQFLTYRIARLHAKLNAQASRILNDSFGITLNQWRMIAFIGGAGKLTASELIATTAMDKGLVSRNVKSLIAGGLVLSSPSARDNRVQVLSLTASGKHVFEMALPRMQRRQDDLQLALSADEIDIFRSVVDKLERATEKMDDK